MSIEDLMIAHTAALIENTAALNAFSGTVRGSIDDLDGMVDKSIEEENIVVGAETATAEKPAATKAATKTATKKSVKKVAKKAAPAAEEEPSEELVRLNTRLKILHKTKGAAVVKDLLAEFDVAKLGELAADQYGNFGMRLTDLRDNKAEEAEADTEGEMSYDKVRDIILEVSNHDMLGKEIARGFIQDAGADKLPDLTKDQYQEVYDACVAQLNEVEAA